MSLPSEGMSLPSEGMSLPSLGRVDCRTVVCHCRNAITSLYTDTMYTYQCTHTHIPYNGKRMHIHTVVNGSSGMCVVHTQWYVYSV
jgi:hypothetical protein